MTMTDTKIFSVAVEAASKKSLGENNTMKVCDVQSDYSGRFAVVSESASAKMNPDSAKLNPESTNLNPGILQPTSTPVVTSTASLMKKAGKNGKKKKKKANNPSSSTSDDDLFKVNSAKTREITPQKIEESTFDDDNVFKFSFNANKTTSAASTMMMAEVTKVEVKEDVSTHSDEFLEITNTKADLTDDEVEADKFFIKEDDEDNDDDDDDQGQGQAVPNWVDDLITSDAILSGIKSAEKKWKEETESEEDGFDFRPKRGDGSGNGISSGSFADSESSLGNNNNNAVKEKEGWSFEADELDVNQLINEVVNSNNDNEVIDDVDEEEKTPLEDVFKFDSELAAEENMMNLSLNEFPPIGATSAKVKLREDKIMAKSMDESKIAVATTSESSVGSSPNVKKTKGKKKKKKRTF